jgi:D-alanyl-D-alanine carboxypeptidase
MFMSRKTLIILFIGFLTPTAFAQNFDKIKLDSYLTALETNNKLMGSVAVAKDGIIIYSKSIGFADAEKGIKANENSQYRIGSISKTFTTVLVLKAIEEKKLSLEQTIDKYFPALKNGSRINIKYLLGHRSGIHNFTDDKDYLTWNTQPKTEKEMLEIIEKGGNDFEPNSKAAYSNSNFVLLTFILQKTFKKPYAELLNQYIIKPIGLKNTYLGKNMPNKSECKSYSFKNGWKLEPETDISIPLGAGGIVSTPSDLTKFGDALFGGKLLRSESLALMKNIQDGYGLGLFQIPFFDKNGYGHGGAIDGFNSMFGHFIDGNISYSFISNGANYNINNVSIAVLSAVYGKPYQIPDFSTYSVTSTDLDPYLGVYASKQIPLKITVTKENAILIAQATGQSSFPLEATAKNKFKFDQAGIILEFNPAEKTMILIQGGGQFTFTKEIN